MFRFNFSIPKRGDDWSKGRRKKERKEKKEEREEGWKEHGLIDRNRLSSCVEFNTVSKKISDWKTYLLTYRQTDKVFNRGAPLLKMFKTRQDWRNNKNPFKGRRAVYCIVINIPLSLIGIKNIFFSHKRKYLPLEKTDIFFIK